MSEHHAGGHPAMDYAEHNRTYHGFLALFRYGTAACIALLVGMFVFLV